MPRELTQAQERAIFFQALANLGTGTYGPYGDLFDWSSFDSFYLLSTATEVRLFSVGQGSQDPISGNNKTLADTNMVGNEIAPKGSKILIQYLKVFLKPDAILTEATLLNIYEFMSNAVLNIKIFGKDTYGLWGLDELFGIPMSSVLTPAVAGNTAEVATDFRSPAVFPLKIPIVVASQVRFDAIITFPGGQTDAAIDGGKFKLSLTGIEGRLS